MRSDSPEESLVQVLRIIMSTPQGGWPGSASFGMRDVLAGPGARRGALLAAVTQLNQTLEDLGIDWVRVEAIERNRLLRLRAEMKLPGLAWLEFSLDRIGDGTRLRQRAIFVPHGLSGHLYWWSVWPFHGPVFGSMLHHIAAAASSGVPAPPVWRRARASSASAHHRARPPPRGAPGG